MRIMKLSKFFERFDSARDKLKIFCDKTSLDISNGAETYSRFIGDRHLAMKTLFGYHEGVRYLDGFRGETFPSLQKRKGDVRVLGNYCWVPHDLMDDIRFAEESYKRYFAGKEGNNGSK